MRSMSAHIAAQAKSLPDILLKEMDANMSAVEAYPEKDWPRPEKERVKEVVGIERELVRNLMVKDETCDSVNGDLSMPTVYPGYSAKTTDVITGRTDSVLVLSEIKYLIKVGGVGPFGGPSGFRSRIADKFCEMQAELQKDGESVDPLRIIVETEEQLPHSILCVNDLINGEYDNADAFSSDSQPHHYVLCSSRNLRQMIENPPIGSISDDYFFFTL